MKMNFDKLTKYLDDLPREGVPGCDLCVWVEHQPVYRHQAGTAKGNETYWLYSATKVLTMTVTMRLMEQGVLRLSDEAGDYLPVFKNLMVQDGDTARPAKTALTLERLMAMQGGLDYDYTAPAIQRVLNETGGDATTLQMAAAYAEKPLHFDPGMGFRYSLCHDVVGAILEAATGKPLHALAEELVLTPLGIKDLTFHPNPAQLARLAPQFTVDASGKTVPIPNRRDSVTDMPRYDSGGGGLMGGVDSYMLLADALANGGVGRNGARVLTRGSIDDMRRDRQTGPSRPDWLKVKHKRGYGYGLGVRTLVDPASSRSPVGEFGWDGAAGAWVLMDPENRVAAFYAQHVTNMLRAYYEFHPAIRDLIYEGLGM